MNRQRYKKLKESNVLEVTQSLCKANQTTTTLDIKNHLRQQGFWAQQGDISMLMDRLNDSGVVDWVESGGGYRLYSLVTSNTLNTTVQPITQQPSTIGTPVTPKKTNKVNDWKCIVDGFPCTTYMNQNLTRSQARWKYAKGVDIDKFVDKNVEYKNLTNGEIRDIVYRKTKGLKV